MYGNKRTHRHTPPPIHTHTSEISFFIGECFLFLGLPYDICSTANMYVSICLELLNCYIHTSVNRMKFNWWKICKFTKSQSQFNCPNYRIHSENQSLYLSKFDNAIAEKTNIWPLGNGFIELLWNYRCDGFGSSVHMYEWIQYK